MFPALIALVAVAGLLADPHKVTEELTSIAYEVEEGRGFLELRPLQLLVTLVQVLLLALVALALVVSGPLAHAAGAALGMDAATVQAWQIAKWPVMAAVVAASIGLLYYAAPNAKLRGFRSVRPGRAGSPDRLGVGLRAVRGLRGQLRPLQQDLRHPRWVIGFLVRLWLTNIAILFGAQFDAERERSREITEGRPGDERELQIPMRVEPEPHKRSRTA